MIKQPTSIFSLEDNKNKPVSPQVPKGTVIGIVHNPPKYLAERNYEPGTKSLVKSPRWRARGEFN
jgi:hypothetical protein